MAVQGLIIRQALAGNLFATRMCLDLPRYFPNSACKVPSIQKIGAEYYTNSIIKKPTQSSAPKQQCRQMVTNTCKLIPAKVCPLLGETAPGNTTYSTVEL